MEENLGVVLERLEDTVRCSRELSSEKLHNINSAFDSLLDPPILEPEPTVDGDDDPILFGNATAGPSIPSTDFQKLIKTIALHLAHLLAIRSPPLPPLAPSEISTVCSQFISLHLLQNEPDENVKTT